MCENKKMEFSLWPREKWENASQALAKSLGLKESYPFVRVHSSPIEAVMEVALPLTQLYSHKRSLAFIRGGTPFFEGLTSWYLKEAYQVLQTSWSELDTKEKIIQWCQALKKDTAAVFLSEDHYLTGQIYLWKAVVEQLQQMKIPTVRISHRLHLREGYDISFSQSARVCLLSHQFAFSLLGERMKLQPLSSIFHPWDENDIKKIKREPNFEDRKTVESLESELQEFCFFSQPTERLYDRLILRLQGLNADAVRVNLGFAKAHSLTSCEWQTRGHHQHLQWWGLSSENASEILIIPKENFHQGLPGQLKEACQKITLLQQWTTK